MIETATTASFLQNSHQPPQKMLKMVENERMGGSVPAWVPVEPGTSAHVETVLSGALNRDGAGDASQALGYAGGAPVPRNAQEFTFGDLLDMVNPLQHIPIVNYAYREVTGDEIKPIGKIVGGAVYGGAFGAAGGLMDAILTQETGKDMGEHVMDRAFGEKEQNAALSFVDLSAPLDSREPITQVVFTEGSGLYGL